MKDAPVVQRGDDVVVARVAVGALAVIRVHRLRAAAVPLGQLHLDALTAS